MGKYRRSIRYQNQSRLEGFEEEEEVAVEKNVRNIDSTLRSAL
jgi:hypothetical protein